jgi:hypothetical protein
MPRDRVGASLPSANQIRVSKSLLSTDLRTGLSEYDGLRPFLTIGAAMAASSAGDTISVAAGIYPESVAMKDGVTLHLDSGALIDRSGADYAIRVEGNDITCRVTGSGRLNGGNAAVNVSGADNDVDIDVAQMSGGNWALTSDGTNKIRIESQGEMDGIIVSGGTQLDVTASKFTKVTMADGEATVVHGYGAADCPVDNGFCIYSINGAHVQWFGDLKSSTDAVDARLGGHIEVFGNLVSTSDTAVFCDTSAEVIVHGTARNLTDGNGFWNLKGNGQAILCESGTVAVYGDISGILPISNKDGDVTVWGNVTVDYNGRVPVYRPYYNELLYTTAYITLSGGGGTGAKLGAEVNSDGKIVSISVVSGGSGYVTPPTATIAGRGTGGEIAPVIRNGVVTGAVIVNGGTGYTSAYDPPDISHYLGVGIANIGTGRTRLNGSLVSSFGNVPIRMQGGEVHVSAATEVKCGWNNSLGYGALVNGGELVTYPGAAINVTADTYAIYDPGDEGGLLLRGAVFPRTNARTPYHIQIGVAPLGK